MGRGSTAGQVKAVSDNIMSMVKGGAGGTKGGRGQGGPAGGRARGGAVGKPSSLMDLVDTACQRKFGRTFTKKISKKVMIMIMIIIIIIMIIIIMDNIFLFCFWVFLWVFSVCQLIIVGCLTHI